MTNDMSRHTETTHYDRLQATLELAGLELRASEVHGMVCGEICRQIKLGQKLGQDPDFAALIGVSAPDSGPGKAVLEVVEALTEETTRSLQDGMGLTLLLPDEDAPIEERTEALADWARGFVLALLRGNKLSADDREADSAEVVQDLSKISEAQPGGRAEEDERALAELEEYMRVGAQLVFEELHPDEGASSPEQELH